MESLVVLVVAYTVAAALTVVAVLFICVSVYYYYIHRKYSHLPSPKGASFYSGHVPILMAQIKKGTDIMDTFKRWADECGPVYVFWAFQRPTVVVAHPEIIKELSTIKHPKPAMKAMMYLWNRQRLLGESLFTIQHHKEWKSRRKTYDPSFSRRYLDDLVPQFNKVVRKYMVNDLRDVADGKTPVDMKEIFTKVTLNVISWVAFGVDFTEDEYVATLCGSQSLLQLLELTMEGGNLQLNNPLIPYLKPFGGHEYTDAAAKIREIGRYCIQKRIELLQNGKETPQDILTQIITLSQAGGDLQLEDLVDDFVTFYIAGQETTSNTLSFALIELLQTPELLQRVLTEIEEVIGADAVINKAHLDQLEIIQAVIDETLRLHPTATLFEKLTGEDIVTQDYRIPKDTVILCSPYISHRDPEHFDNPVRFDPGRFESDQKKPSSYVYMPFGIGHRSCIGRTFAMMEMKVIIALLFKNFDLTLSEGFVFKKIHAFTTKPANGIPCTVTMRT